MQVFTSTAGVEWRERLELDGRHHGSGRLDTCPARVDRDASGPFLPWIVAVMVYLASLAVAAALPGGDPLAAALFHPPKHCRGGFPSTRLDFAHKSLIVRSPLG